MPYADHFKLTDDLIQHLDSVLLHLNDPYIEAKYTGFLSVSAAAVLESALKEIFIDFSSAKHKVFGDFSKVFFFRINGRIALQDIRDTYLRHYGERYAKRFKTRLDKLEFQELRASNTSIKAAYGNLLTWRHEFAHAGRVPANASYSEVKLAYECGKKLMGCLASCMNR